MLVSKDDDPAEEELCAMFIGTWRGTIVVKAPEKAGVSPREHIRRRVLL
jgi:hypothetical protein